MTWEPYAKSVLENSNKHGHSAGILGKVDASDWATGEVSVTIHTLLFIIYTLL